MNDFIRSKRLYMLLTLPFLMAITFIGGRLLTPSAEYVHINGSINLDFISQLDSFWLSIVSSLLVLSVAYIIFLTNERFKLLHQTTALPSFIYILLASGIIVKLCADSLLISVLLLAIAIDRFQIAINDIRSNKSLFDVGFLIALAVIFYPKFVLLIVWALFISFFSGRSTLKDILALLIGLLVPSLFLCFYYFWTDKLESGMDIFTQNLLIGEYIHTFSIIEWGYFGILLLLLFVSLFHFSSRYSILVVNRRRGLLTYVSMIFFMIVSLLVIPGNLYDFIYIISLPLSIIYSQFFLSNKSSIFGNIMFILLLSAYFLTYFF